jgi:hypothetical protein
MRNFSKALLFGAIILSSGCNDFLEEQDPSNLNPDNFYTLPEHAEPAVIAAYDRLRFIGEGAGIFSRNWQLLEAVTGTTTSETGQNQDLNNLINVGYNADNGHLFNWWNGMYDGIANANLAIRKIEGIANLGESLRQKYIAEAKFLRALNYFWAVRLFGDVPLITEPIFSSTDPNLLPARTPQEAIYNQIVEDLLAAELADLPWTDANGRVSKGAIKSLLANVYLTMAGYPLNKGTEYYQKAADKAKEVITNGSFSLFPNYADLHSLATENRGEHIFMIQYAPVIADNPFQSELLPNFKEISAYNSEIGSTVPTPSFVKSFEPGDRRAKEKEFFYTSYYNNGNGAEKPLGAPYIYKHFDVQAHGTAGVAGTARAGINWPLIRYAEVLLIYAEAQNEVSGPTADAVNAVKLIRDRAELPTPTAGETNKEAFRELVWRERWHELCYEGKTWFDMVRLRKVYNEATNGFDNFVGHKFSYGPVLEERHLLFPLPTSEVRNNPNLKP